jgi:hypothetical protein
VRRSMDRILAEAINTWFLVLILAGAMLVAWGFGWWLGSRLLRAGSSEGSVSKFDDASLALVGLLLAFTFGMSLAKHDHRRDMVVADSNAIGDFYTCASMLKEPVRTKLQTLTREYLEFRIEVVRKGVDQAALVEAIRRSQQMQAQMTDLAVEAVTQGTPIAVSLTNTLNALTSNHVARVAAAEDRLPASIVLLLFVSAVMTTMLVGREQGIAGRTEIAGTLTFILLTTLAVYVTLDLNQPQTGMVTVDQRPLQRLLSSMPK